MAENEKPDKAEREVLLSLFWKLSNPNDQTRLQAASKIVENLQEKQKNYLKTKEGDGPWCVDVKYSLERLIHGLASERKACRLGFSCVLTQLLMRLEICENADIKKVLDIIDEKLKITKEKSEEKGMLIGRVFALLAIVHACKLDNAEESVGIIYEQLMKYSKLKSYLKYICYHGITELIKKASNAVFDKVLWQGVSGMLEKGWEGCDAELFQILQTCCEHQSETCGKTFLKANNWIGQKAKKVELIGPHSYKYLGQMLPSTTHCHPRVHPLCYEVIENVSKSDDETFRKFWKDAVDTGLLESSPERKYLALKLSIHALPLIQEEQIPTVWSNKLVMCIFYALSNKNNPLHQVCKTEFINELSSKMSDEKITGAKQLRLLFQLLTSPAGLFLDENTEARCVQAVIGSFHLPALEKYIDWLKNLFLTGKLEQEGIKEVSLDTARRWSMTQLSQLIRNARLPRRDGWLLSTIKFIFFHYHFIPLSTIGSKIHEVSEIDERFIPVAEKVRDHMKHCLDPAVNSMNNMPGLQTTPIAKTSKLKFHGTCSDDEFWMYKLIEFTDTLLNDSHVSPFSGMKADSREVWTRMLEKIRRIRVIEEVDSSRASEGTALRLLLVHVGIRLLNATDDDNENACEVLHDLFNVVDQRFGEDTLKNGTTNGGDESEPYESISWVEVVIETILNMLSQNSHSIRSVADQVFRLLSPKLTKKGLRLILDVLDPARRKEILHNDDDAQDDEEEMEEEDGEGDNHEENESSDSDDSAFDDEDVSDEKSEEREFREKVKEALGDAAESSEDEKSSEHDKKEDDEKSNSDVEMDDDAMMRIDSMLAEVFRQKKMSKKKTEQDSHKQLQVFQLRCLDLVEILANRRHSQDLESVDSDPLILEAVCPLLVTVQHASRNTTDMTLAEKASVLLRVKICKMKKYPKNLTQETISRCHSDLEVMMSIAQKAHSVFMCHLASDCCLFLIRVLCGNSHKESTTRNPTGVADVARIQKIYKGALENFMTQRESRLQPCVMQDFITRFPILAADMASDLLKYIKEGVQVYRKSRACVMLHDLLKSPAGKEKCKPLLFQIVSVMNELVEKATSNPGELKTKYCVEIMRLYHQAILLLQSTGKLKSLNSAVLTTSLKTFIELPEVKKSQELTNWSWKVLQGFGIMRNAEKANKKKSKKRKKTNSESEMAEKNTENEPPSAKIDMTKVLESKKDLKQKVVKEKKERRKGKRGQNMEKICEGPLSEQTENEEGKAKLKKRARKKKKAAKPEA